MRSHWKKRLFAGVVLLGTLMLCESALQISVCLSPRIDELLAPPWRADLIAARSAKTVPDDILGHRGNPLFAEHDRNGYRNAVVPAAATIVALGDSQTYGSNAGPDEAWPQQLGRTLDCETYNMGVGGYGPTHNLICLPQALKLNPKLVIVALYAGNDLYDCYSYVHDRQQLSALMSNNSVVLEEIRAAEETDPLLARIERYQEAIFGPSQPIAGAPSARPCQERSLRGFFSSYCKLYGLLRATRRAFTGTGDSPAAMRRREVLGPAAWETARQRAAEAPDQTLVIETGPIKTLLMPAYRLCALNVTDPRIAEGERIALLAVDQMCRESRAAGAEFLVVLIPTKAFVCHEAITTSNAPTSRDYELLVAHEAAVLETTRRWLTARGIRTVDALPALRAAVQSGPQPYSPSFNGHPNAHGYHAIATAVAEEIQKAGLLEAAHVVASGRQ